jgi:hypothetical protein
MVLQVCAADRAMDYAAEDASVETLKAFEAGNVSVGRIAMLPLMNDTQHLYPVVRAELARYPGLYEFFVRDDREWNVLISEIEFGDRRGDVMDTATIQKFGRIPGVSALLYGSVREASVDADGNGIVRLALTLSEVETGRQLWSGHVVGEYRKLLPPSGNLTKAVVDASRKAVEQFKAARFGLGDVDIFLMPCVSGGTDFSDFIRSEFISAGGDGVRFYADLSAQKGQRMAMNLAREASSGQLSVPALAQMMKQLESVGGFLSDEGRASAPVAKREKAVLLCRFGQNENTADLNLTRVGLNLQLVRMSDGQQLWGANVQGASVDVVGFSWILGKYWKQIGLGLILLVAVIVLASLMRRVR